MADPPGPLADAYAACEKLARSHYENFPVASWLLPAAMRPHIAALYAFARVADDVADEGTARPEERRAQLQEWRERLHQAAAEWREHQTMRSADARSDRDELILTAVAHTIRIHNLPILLFDDLISAFGQDTMTTRYASWCDLLEYCRRSANPVGRLVLRIAGYDDPALDRSSDALCTALQLTNFWQDLGRDWRAGRLYVPAEVIEASAARVSDLDSSHMTDAWTQAMAACVGFTVRQFTDGRGVCDAVRGRLGFELRFTWLGGMRILERVERGRRDLLQQRPALGLADAPWLAWNAIWWRRPA